MSRQAKDLRQLAELARLVSDRDLAELAAISAARQGAEARRRGLIEGLAEARAEVLAEARAEVLAEVVAGVVAEVVAGAMHAADDDGAPGVARSGPAAAQAAGFATLDRHTVAVMRGLTRTEEDIARLTEAWQARRQVAARSFGRVSALAEIAHEAAGGDRRR